VSQVKNKSEHVLYGRWHSMRGRCYSLSNTSFKQYGGRGIKVCQRWLFSFENFVADMGIPPADKQILDRIDVNGDYCPENCRWVNHLESGQNTTRITKITINGKTQHAAQWARETGASAGAIVERIKKGETDPARIFHKGKLPNHTCKGMKFKGNRANLEQAMKLLGLK